MGNLLETGDIIKLERGHKVYTLVPKCLAFSNRPGIWDLVMHDVRIEPPFMFLARDYVVTRTSMVGGGSGHGPYDTYPDGHKVEAKALDADVCISFYQTGFFTAMIRDIEPIGKARISTIWEIQRYGS